MTQPQNHLIIYDRNVIEPALRQCANWLDVNVMDAVTTDDLDRHGFFLTRTYDALADFILAYIQGDMNYAFFPGPTPSSWVPTARGGPGMGCIATYHFDYQYSPSMATHDIQAAMSEFFFQRFENIARTLGGLIKATVYQVEQEGRTIDSVFFHHARKDVGALVLVSLAHDELSEERRSQDAWFHGAGAFFDNKNGTDNGLGPTWAGYPGYR